MFLKMIDIIRIIYLSGKGTQRQQCLSVKGESDMPMQTRDI